MFCGLKSKYFWSLSIGLFFTKCTRQLVVSDVEWVVDKALEMPVLIKQHLSL